MITLPHKPRSSGRRWGDNHSVPRYTRVALGLTFLLGLLLGYGLTDLLGVV
jgi:hypothetical protein